MVELEKITLSPAVKPIGIFLALEPLLKTQGIQLSLDLTRQPYTSSNHINLLALKVEHIEEKLGIVDFEFSKSAWSVIVPDSITGSILLSKILQTINHDSVIYRRTEEDWKNNTQRAEILH